VITRSNLGFYKPLDIHKMRDAGQNGTTLKANDTFFNNQTSFNLNGVKYARCESVDIGGIKL